MGTTEGGAFDIEPTIAPANAGGCRSIPTADHNVDVVQPWVNGNRRVGRLVATNGSIDFG